jgi:hypothetical protein
MMTFNDDDFTLYPMVYRFIVEHFEQYFFAHFFVRFALSSIFISFRLPNIENSTIIS